MLEKQTLALYIACGRYFIFSPNFYEIIKCKTKSQSWLCFRRDTPPSPEDVEFYEQQMLQLKKRVAELDAEDAKLRIQEIASREGAGRINFRYFYPQLTE